MDSSILHRHLFLHKLLSQRTYLPAPQTRIHRTSTSSPSPPLCSRAAGFEKRPACRILEGEPDSPCTDTPLFTALNSHNTLRRKPLKPSRYRLPALVLSTTKSCPQEQPPSPVALARWWRPPHASQASAPTPAPPCSGWERWRAWKLGGGGCSELATPEEVALGTPLQELKLRNGSASSAFLPTGVSVDVLRPCSCHAPWYVLCRCKEGARIAYSHDSSLMCVGFGVGGRPWLD